MKNSMQMVISHVRIEVEMALMTRWYKKAKPQWDHGQLQIWTPERAGLSMVAAAQGDKEDVRFVSSEDEESEDVEEET